MNGQLERLGATSSAGPLWRDEVADTRVAL